MTSRSLRLSLRVSFALVCFVLLAAVLRTARSHAAQNSRVSQGTDGEQIFVSTCGACHGMDGRGGVHAPNIASNPNLVRLSKAQIERIVRDGIPSGGMPSFRELGEQKIASVVAYLRTLQGRPVSRALPGDPASGRLLFFGVAGCAKCHMVAGHGGFLGPDLTGYARSHSAGDVRSAILDPNRNLPFSDYTVVAVTRGGRKLVGLARNEDNFSLQLQTADGAFHLLMKSNLNILRHEPRSLMPADYSSKLSGTEIDDLISFLARQDAGRR